jgi:hypothetical protein
MNTSEKEKKKMILPAQMCLLDENKEATGHTTTEGDARHKMQYITNGLHGKDVQLRVGKVRQVLIELVHDCCQRGYTCGEVLIWLEQHGPCDYPKQRITDLVYPYMMISQHMYMIVRECSVFSIL